MIDNGGCNAYFFKYKNEIIGLIVLTCDIPTILDEYQLSSNNYMLIDSVRVKDKYRGYGLQRQMLKFAYMRAVKLKMDGLVAAIHPNNKYSLNNFIEEKYELTNVITIHGGMRKIMIKRV